MCNVYCTSLICSMAIARLSSASLLGTPIQMSAQGMDALCCTPVNLHVNLYFCAELMLLCWKRHITSVRSCPLVPHLTALAALILKALCGELTVSTFYRCRVVAVGSP